MGAGFTFNSSGAMSEKTRRRSSFASATSPWSRRRASLSQSMIHSEDYSVYESSSYFFGESKCNVISLKEGQGFIFNQDLFASPFQQSQALAREKRIRSLSSSSSYYFSDNGNDSRRYSSNVSFACKDKNNFRIDPSLRRRRHTTYDLNHSFGSSENCKDDEAIEDDSDYQFNNANNDFNEGEEQRKIFSEDKYSNSHNNHRFHSGADLYTKEDDVFMNSSDESTDNVDASYADGTKVYKVNVTDILIDENENAIFPD